MSLTNIRRDRRGLLLRLTGVVGALAGLFAAAGCAGIGHAEPLSRTGASMFATLAGTTTSQATSQFPQTTSLEVAQRDYKVVPEGVTAGDLGNLASDAVWTVKLPEKLNGLNLGPLSSNLVSDQEKWAPFQVGDVMMVGLRSSDVNFAGVAAFDVQSGDLLWQDRSLQCQRVDLGGALPCRQNSGEWSPLNPRQAALAPAINPGFTPEVFAYEGGVLYSAGANGKGDVLVSAGSIAQPNAHWTVQVPRGEGALTANRESSMELVGNRLAVNIGDAGVVIDTSQGVALQSVATEPVSQPFPNSGYVSGDALISEKGAELFSSDNLVVPGVRIPSEKNKALVTKDQLISADSGQSIASFSAPLNTTSMSGATQLIGDLVVVNQIDDRLTAYDASTGNEHWSIPAAVSSVPTVTDGSKLTFIATENGTSYLRTIDLATGETVNQRTQVALGSPIEIQSARSGLFHFDPVASMISYYSAD